MKNNYFYKNKNILMKNNYFIFYEIREDKYL